MDNTNRIVIFKNHNKKEDKHPDYTGKVNVDGRELTVSLWLKENDKEKYFSETIQEPFKKMENTSEKIRKDDVPF